ncbi:MAG TPA: tetratricopeptide repeat protein [Smithellaceae bacterium]|nr:tetratricopeptide repeat protein [Smithella sp.]HRY34790.1 tetratricopeptide repeat protein [Smithellaceae bacterium]
MRKEILTLMVFLYVMILVSPALCQTGSALLEEGIKQYQNENYEEAIEILEKVRSREPESSLAAFFLGMAYKQTIDYDKAAVNLEDALTLKPAVKEALADYINILFHLNKLEEAKKWINVAREQNVEPASIYFLEGMILAQEKNYGSAVESFEKAKSLDRNLVQMADYQIGLCYLKEQKFKNAGERFKATASYDPQSDLAASARQYFDAVEKSIFYTRPIRVTMGIYGGYDSNVVSSPRQESLSGSIGSSGSGVLSPSVRIEYVPRLNRAWLFNAMYSSSANLHDRFVHSRDLIANTVSFLPGYNFGRFSISILGSYTNYLLRTDSDIVPDGNAGYKHYEDYFTGGPVLKLLVTENQILELFTGYDKKNYYNQVIPSGSSRRDAEGFRGYLSWVWFFWRNGFVNLRYEICKEAADGIYWDNLSNRLSAGLVLPILPENLTRKIGSLYLQMAGGFTFQDYSHPQPYSDAAGYAKTGRRKDEIYNGSVGLNWDITKNWSCVVQYSHIKSDSNIPVYEYTRNLYTMGLEFKF